MEYKGKIKFYDDEIEVLYPEDFNLCREKIAEMLGFTKEDFLEKVSIYYIDEDGDKVILNENADYEMFINYLKENQNNKNLVFLIIELKEKSESSITKISQEIINNKEKYPEQANIDKKKEAEINNEIKDKIKNEKDIEKNNINEIKEKKNDNIDQINYLDIFKNDFQMSIKENNNYIEDIDREEFNKIKNEIKINNNNLQKNYKEKINKYENNNINDINIKNDFPKNINIKKEHLYTYPETCRFCKKKPLYDVFYSCLKCQLIMCSDCELIKGSQHMHPLYKIQTYDQYMNSDIKFERNIMNKMEGFGSAIKGIYESVTDFIANKKNNLLNNEDNKQNNNANLNINDNVINNKNNNDYKALIKDMRNSYDLGNKSDEEINTALTLSNGDIYKAIELLFN